MSTGQQPSASANAIRDEVRRTVERLAELARTERDFDQFCEVVLKEVVQMTGAHGALLWSLGEDRTLQPSHRFGAHPSEQARVLISEDHPRHRQALGEVIRRKTPLGVNSTALQVAAADGASPGPESSDSDADANAESDTGFLLLMAPICDRAEDCRGVLELVQRGEIRPQAREGYLRFLSQVAQLFQRWHEHQDLVRLSQHADHWQERMQLIREVHRSIDLEPTAYAIANESRRLLRCDRVSVARWNGRRCRIQAISSQDRFDNRANVVRLLGDVATASVAADSRFWVTGNTEGLAPEVATRINEYLDEAHCRTLIVLPLKAPEPERPDLEMRSRQNHRAVKLGALIVEYFDADVEESRIEEDCQLIVEQSELALENARQHGQIFMQPVWKRIGGLQRTLFRDHWTKTMIGLAVLAALVLLLLLFPKTLTMKVDGVMQPTRRKTIFSQVEGRVSEVLVEQHADVTAGQLLLRVEDPDLEEQILQTEWERESIDSQIESASKQLALGGMKRYEKEELGNAIGLYRQQRETLGQQLEILYRRREDQRVVSPMDGTILTRQPKRLLQDLPATRDQALLEIADLSGPWQLELRIPEGRVGYVDQAFSENEGQPLVVEFKIATNPNLTLYGTLDEVDRRAVPSDQGVAEFRAIVDIDGDQLKQLQDELRSGAGVTARIECGTRSLGFVWFYQVYDFLRTQVFF